MSASILSTRVSSVLPGLAGSFFALVLAAGCSTLGRSTAAEPPATAPESLRTTSEGPVLGFDGPHASHGWLGIPFAKPPLGELRWRAPRPPTSRSQPLRAVRAGDPCTQPASPLSGVAPAEGPIVGSEDCLYLNVWAPRWASRDVPEGAERLPVMVWIHGGGNTVGAGAGYSGARLASAHGAIVITVNYRLGPFGWFRHPALRAGVEDPLDASGNYGTLDLIQALRWVRANAEAFGGNPELVTVFGESAGGQNIYSLLASPLAEGLFERAIIQSGIAVSSSIAAAENRVDAEEPGRPTSSAEIALRSLIARGRAADRSAAVEVAQGLAPSEMAALLRSTNAKELLSLYLDPQSGGGALFQLPVLIEDGVVLPERTLFEHVTSREGTPSVPVLLGTNRDEFRLFQLVGGQNVCWLLGLLPRPCDREQYVRTADYASAYWKATGADEVASAWVRHGKSDVFVYRFDWDEAPSGPWVDLGTLLGAAHGMEIPFVFGDFEGSFFGGAVFTPENRAERVALSEAMMAYWAAFARRGDPARGISGGLPRWRPWTEDSPEAARYIVLDSRTQGGLRMVEEPITRASWLERISDDPYYASRESERCALIRSMGDLLEWDGAQLQELRCSEMAPVGSDAPAR